MPEYDRETRYHFARLHLECLGGMYRGRGILTWNPDHGFQIEAPVERLGPPLQGKFDLGKLRAVKPEELRAIRVVLGRSSYAFSPRLHLGPSLELLHGSHLSIPVSRMVFAQRVQSARGASRWCGSATYACADTISLPEQFRRETHVVDEIISTESGRGAFVIKDDDQHVRCWIPDEKTIRLEWAFNASKWPFRYAWTFGLAAGLAMSILAGQTVRLLERTAWRRDHRYRELRKRETPHSLGFLCPFGGVSLIDKGAFATLAHFLNERHATTDVCESVFDQLAEASRQQTHQARELLVGTILEAALRTLETKPLGSDESWNVEGALKRFREKYWDRDWKKYAKRALNAFETLRHRNAHPDWLAGSGARRPNERIITAFDDLQFLVRFYGYMILALAGIKTKPRFPAPVQDWKAPMTVSIGPATGAPNDADALNPATQGSEAPAGDQTE